MSVTGWSATENRLVEPYARADSVLDSVGFRFDPIDEFGFDEVTWFDREVLARPIAPEFLLDVDASLLSSRVGIPVADLRAAVVVRDRAMKHWEAVRSWPLAELPPTFPVRVEPGRFALGRRTEFVLLVTPAATLPPREGRAARPDQVVASRSFAANVRRDGSRFNVATVEAEWFERYGMPKDAVWAIDWETRDPDVEPIAALTVVVNERYADRLQDTFGGAAGSNALAAQIAIDVFAEAAVVALENAVEYRSEGSTLLGSVVTGLGIRGAEDFEALRTRLREDGGRVSAASFIRARVQSRIGLGRTLERRDRGGER